VSAGAPTNVKVATLRIPVAHLILFFVFMIPFKLGTCRPPKQCFPDGFLGPNRRLPPLFKRLPALLVHSANSFASILQSAAKTLPGNSRGLPG
jgi:hypothetical protein